MLISRPLLDPDHPHPRPLHHLHPYLLHHRIPLAYLRRAHHLQHPPPLHRRVRHLFLRPCRPVRSVGRHSLARYWRLGSRRGDWDIRVRDGGVCPGQLGVPRPCWDPEMGVGRSSSWKLGLLPVSSSLSGLYESRSSCRFRNIYPVLLQSDNPMSKIIILAVLGLHAAMAFGMKVLFFSWAIFVRCGDHADSQVHRSRLQCRPGPYWQSYLIIAPCNTCYLQRHLATSHLTVQDASSSRQIRLIWAHPHDPSPEIPQTPFRKVHSASPPPPEYHRQRSYRRRHNPLRGPLHPHRPHFLIPCPRPHSVPFAAPQYRPLPPSIAQTHRLGNGSPVPPQTIRAYCYAADVAWAHCSTPPRRR